MGFLSVVDKPDIDVVWGCVKQYLDNGLSTSQGELTVSDIKASIDNGLMVLVISIGEDSKITGATVFEIVSYPGYSCAHIVSLGGSGLMLNKEDTRQFGEILSKYGISKASACVHPRMKDLACRVGWTKIYDVVAVNFGD